MRCLISGGKDNFGVGRRCWFLPSAPGGPGRLGRGKLEKAGLQLEPSRPPAPFGFSAATDLGSRARSADVASSPWPLTDLGQNYEMPKMKYFLCRE